MTVLKAFTKTPAERLDYLVDFGKRWLEPGDTIVSIATAISGGTAIIDAQAFTTQTAQVWITGGLDQEENHVTVRATTANGIVKEACFDLLIRNC